MRHRIKKRNHLRNLRRKKDRSQENSNSNVPKRVSRPNRQKSPKALIPEFPWIQRKLAAKRPFKSSKNEDPGQRLLKLDQFEAPSAGGGEKKPNLRPQRPTRLANKPKTTRPEPRQPESGGTGKTIRKKPIVIVKPRRRELGNNKPSFENVKQTSESDQLPLQRHPSISSPKNPPATEASHSGSVAKNNVQNLPIIAASLPPPQNDFDGPNFVFPDLDMDSKILLFL